MRAVFLVDDMDFEIRNYKQVKRNTRCVTHQELTCDFAHKYVYVGLHRRGTGSIPDQPMCN
jgi:hypothetical protein